MAGRGSKNHVHKYNKVPFGNSDETVWACSLDDCTHYMPKHMESFMAGKRSKCWECNETFMLDSDSMKEDRPVCIKCRMKSKGIDIDNLDAVLNN